MAEFILETNNYYSTSKIINYYLSEKDKII